MDLDENIELVDLDTIEDKDCQPQKYRDVLAENLFKIIKRVNCKFDEIDKKVGILNEENLI